MSSLSSSSSASASAAPSVAIVGTGLAGCACAMLLGRALTPPPPETVLGELMAHLVTPAKHFQSSNAHFGLMPESEDRVKKRDRKAWYAERARGIYKNQFWLKFLEDVRYIIAKAIFSNYSYNRQDLSTILSCQGLYKRPEYVKMQRAIKVLTNLVCKVNLTS